MKKVLMYSAAAMLLFAASCKENVIPIDTSAPVIAEDSTYKGDVEPAQQRRMLIEEMSGVTCTNCPQGSEMLESLNVQYNNRLSIVTIHTGTFSDPIPGKSIQNFQTDDGRALRDLVWKGQGNKPTAIFDRLLIGKDGTYFNDGSPDWPAALVKDTVAHPTTPLNIELKTAYYEATSEYGVEVKVKYTQEVTAKHAIHIFLTQSKIIDVQQLSHSDFDDNFQFNHVFRDAITPVATGQPVLPNATSDTKEAGRVYIYRARFKINPADSKQKYWVPANMKVVAFVSDMSSADKHVIHVQETNLQ